MIKKNEIYICTFLTIISINCKNMDSETIDEEQFIKIVNDIAKGWNEGNAELSARYFDDNAVYEEPPKKQFYKGQNNIYEFFGGEEGFNIPMKMKWHNLAFNTKNQIGFGEYTFSMNNQYHGIVVMKFENGKIIKWREYQYESDLDWKNFTGESEFETFK